MRSKIILFLLIAIVLNLSMISAEITISQTKSVYSIGDTLDVSISTSASPPGQLDVSLICDSATRLIFSNYFTSPDNKVDLKRPLLKSFLKDMKGDCRIEATLESEFSITPTFQIADNIETIVSANPNVINPGEGITVKGTAIKANQENLEGFAEFSIDRIGLQFKKSVKMGRFEVNFSFPENTKAGVYQMALKVYDKSGEDIGNHDEKTIELRVKQKPTKIDVMVDKQNVMPGESLNLKPFIYDQTGEEIQGDIKLEVKDTLGSLYFSKTLRTGEPLNVYFLENATAGEYTIKISSLGLESSRLFYIEELEKARFEVLGDTLTVTNIGNVPYTKQIQIAIGSSTETKDIDLQVGKIKKFRLLAPEGNYLVSITDGTESAKMENIGLTGGAIGVQDINDSLNLFTRYPIVWLFLLIVFGLFIVMIAGRTRNKNSYGYSTEKPVIKEVPLKPLKKSDEEEKGFTVIKEGREAKIAEHSLVIDGKKEESAVLNLKIKNSGVMKNTIAKENVGKAAEMINKHKGSLYQSGDSIVGIFTPSMTKTFKNDLTAVKVASEIAASLNEHNRKFKEKIDFGIGINSGDIAVKFEGGKLKFTALGNTLNTAKRIAESARNDVLLSKSTNSRVSNEVKTDKSGEYYSIKRIVDREQHKNFLDNFLKRNS